MRIEKNKFYELLQDISHPSFNRVIPKGEVIRGMWLNTWFPNLNEEAAKRWFRLRDEYYIVNCRVMNKNQETHIHADG